MSKYGYDSDNDEPEVYESSGSEWSESEIKKNNGGRRTSTRNKNKKAVKKPATDSSDSELEEKPKNSRSTKKNGVKRQKIEPKATPKTTPKVAPKPSPVKNLSAATPATPSADGAPAANATPAKSTPAKPINMRDYTTGSFLILKKDAKVGDPSKHPCIWRVDGKALLQKYEAFEDDEGKVKHRTTSVYTGWSALDRDNYAPVFVKVCQQNGSNLVVDLDWEKIKEIDVDSD